MPQATRDKIKRLRRDGMELRAISAELASEGLHAGKDSLSRHLRYCVADLEPSPADADDRALIVAMTVRNRLQRWSGIANTIATDLHEYGLTVEAKIVQSVTVEMMRTPLDSIPSGSTARALLDADTLARSVSAVLHRPDPAHQRVALALAGECEARGGADLAAAFRDLAAPKIRPAGQAGTNPAGRSTVPVQEQS